MKLRRCAIAAPEAHFGGDTLEAAVAKRNGRIVHGKLPKRDVCNLLSGFIDDAQRVLPVDSERNGVDCVGRDVFDGLACDFPCVQDKAIARAFGLHGVCHGTCLVVYELDHGIRNIALEVCV